MEKENIQVNDSGREGMQGAPGLQEEGKFQEEPGLQGEGKFQEEPGLQGEGKFQEEPGLQGQEEQVQQGGKPRRIPDMERGRCILMGSQMHLLPEQVMVHRGQDMVLLERATVHREQARVRLHTRGQVLCQSARKY